MSPFLQYGYTCLIGVHTFMRKQHSHTDRGETGEVSVELYLKILSAERVDKLSC